MESKLPEKIAGKWVWHSGGECAERDALLLKKDFSIFEMPALAELWVATHSFFHVFINGRLATTGPIPHPGREQGAFAIRVDITHLLEVGVNRISVLAHHESVALSGVKDSVKGFWLQLNVEGEPVVFTDQEWLCARPSLYIPTGLRTAPGDVHVETVNLDDPALRRLNEEDGALGGDVAWQRVDIVHPVSPAYCVLEPFAHDGGAMDLLLPDEFVCRGHFMQDREVNWLSFKDAIARRKGELGTYVAYCFIYCQEATSIQGLCVCDEPYLLFLNEVKVKSQAVPELPLRGVTLKERGRELRPQEMVDSEMEMELRQGWNKLMFVQQCSSPGSGATLLWPDLEPGYFKCFTRPDAQVAQGWNIVGPLSAPMALIYGNMPLEALEHAIYRQDDVVPNDVGPYYLACSFEKDETDKGLGLPMALENGQYVIVDFGQTYYAFPHLKIEGHADDLVDVVTSEISLNGEVVSYDIGGRRNAMTLKLTHGENSWIASSPKGARYVMVVARKVKNRVNVRAIGLSKETMDFDDAGSFQCSSPVLEQVWETGVKTLETTMHRGYIDSPTKEQAQTLPDAMIQSWAAYYVFGDYSHAGQAIEAFAHSQLETGELSAMSPSGMFQAVPDYSLCWPVWLQRHYLHTGDMALLKRMIPALLKLMHYYNEMAVSHDGPLGDLKGYLGVYAFIDYGNLDRQGITTALNAFYCRALLSASWLMVQVGDQEQADVFHNRANTVAHQVWHLNWDEEVGLFVDGSQEGVPSRKHSWQSNLLAIYGGIAKPRDYDAIWEKLFQDEAPLERQIDQDFNNPYFKYYILESAFALGKSAWGMMLIHYYWGQMLKCGAKTWWEMFDPEIDSRQIRICSRCSGYGVSPNAYLITELVGIRPAKPGMDMVYFNPTPGDVNWVRATVPTPKGKITVHWKLLDDGTFEVSINSTYPVDVVPVLAPGIASNAVFSVNDKVSILAEEQEE